MQPSEASIEKGSTVNLVHTSSPSYFELRITSRRTLQLMLPRDINYRTRAIAALHTSGKTFPQNFSRGQS